MTDIRFDIKCGKCLFFRPIRETSGDCRRFPPTVTHVPDEAGKMESGYRVGERDSYECTNWPEVEIDSWCGEFRPKDFVPVPPLRPW